MNGDDKNPTKQQKKVTARKSHENVDNVFFFVFLFLIIFGKRVIEENKKRKIS